MPFDSTSAVLDAPSKSSFDPADAVPDHETPPRPNWDALFSGVDKLNEVLTPEQHTAFSALDRNSDKPDTARMMAINQAFLETRLPGVSSETIKANWPAVKQAYAKRTLGINNGEVSDSTLYGKLGERFEQEAFSRLQEYRQGDVWQRMAILTDSFAKHFGPTVKPIAEQQTTPFVKLPEAPKDLPNMWGAGVYNPALVGGIYNSVGKPIIEGVESPLGVGTLAIGPILSAAGKITPVARAALASIQGLFAGVMAKAAVDATPKMVEVLRDPDASFQEQVEAVGTVAGGTLMAVAGAVGALVEIAPKSVKEIKGKTPREAADSLRVEAKDLLADVAEPVPGAATMIVDKAKAVGLDAEVKEVSPAEQAKVIIKAADALDEIAGPRQPNADTHESIIARRAAETELEVVAGEAKGPRSNFETTGMVFPTEEAAIENAQPHQRVRRTSGGSFEIVENRAPQGVESGDTIELTAEPAKAPRTVAEKGDAVSIKNATVEAERAAMGEEPATVREGLKNSEAMKGAMKALEEDPHAGARLVSELAEKPRPPTGPENALLGAEMNRLRLERDMAETELIDAVRNGDRDAEAGAQFRIAKARADFLKAAEIFDASGTHSSDSLRLRQLMIKEDYSLASLERRAQVANKGRPLSPERISEIKDLSDRLQKSEKALADYRVAEEARTAEPPDLPQKPKASPPSPVRKYLGEKAQAARARIMERLKSGRASSGLDPTEIADYAIVGADLIARKVSEFGAWSKKMVDEFGDRIRPYLNEIYVKAADATKEARRLEAFKTRTEKKTTEMKAKLASGDLSKPEPRKPLAHDKESLRLMAERDRVRKELDLAEMRDEMKNRTPQEKVASAFNKWVRFGALSWPTVLAKLTGAAVIRTATTPIEQGVGFGISKLLPELAARAPREGVPELSGAVKAEIKAMSEGLTTGMQGAWDMLRNRDTDLAVLMEKTHLPGGLTDWLGKLHGALKNPTKINEYARALELRMQHAVRNGIDPTDPVQQMRLMHEAYMDANRAIFLQDNAVVDAYKQGLAALKRPNKATGKPSGSGQVMAALIEAELPIVKVPTNVIGEASQILTGWLTGPAKAVFAYARGIENLKPAEADAIMRLMKKGSIGLALTALGFFKASEFGGFYQRGEKRPESDVKPMDIRLGEDVTIPSQLTHNPYVTAMQFGATMRRAADSRFKKSDTAPRGFASGLLAASLGLIEETPFIRETSTIDRYVDPRQSGNAIEGKVASILVPGTVQWLAAQMDKEHPFDFTETPTPRKPEGLLQSIEKNIPGLRQDVPKKKPAH